MKTAYYMLTTQDALRSDHGLDKASGEGHQAVWIRQPGQRTSRGPVGGDNVIDLAAWKAAREQEALEQAGQTDWDEAEDELDWLLDLELDEAPVIPARRPRREHPTLRGELAAALSAVGATAAMVLQALRCPKAERT